MGKRGPKPKGKVKLVWSADFAYGMGLLASDGNLSPDGRHISFVSNEIEQIKNFLKAFKITDIKVGEKKSALSKNTAYRVQFGDIEFYKFLLSIGLMPNKSKTIGKLEIPNKYIFDFLRGSFDGDGTFYSYFDPRWKSSFMVYTEFISASITHIEWIQKKILESLGVSGHITKDRKGTTIQLKYAKHDSIKVIAKLYGNKKGLYLKRKRLKIDESLAMIEALKKYKGSRA